MKKMLLSFAVIAMFASCEKAPNGDEGKKYPDGTLAYAKFTLNVSSGSATRATDAGIAAEGTVKNAVFYVFSAGTLEASVGLSTVEGKETESTVLKITTGRKDVFAVVNFTTNLTPPDLTIGVTTMDQVKEAYNIAFDAAKMTGGTDNVNGFVMFGNVTQDIIKPADETAVVIAIDVYRASAKVSFIYDNDGDGDDVVINNLLGAISEPKFTLGQTDLTVDITRPYMKEGAVNYDPTSPSPLVDALPVAIGKGEAGDGSYDHLLQKAEFITTPAFIEALDKFTDASAIAASKYCAENVISGFGDPKVPVVGELTFVAVQVKYTPKAGIPTEDGGGEVVDGGIIDSEGDFWVVVATDGTKYIFSSEGAAITAIAEVSNPAFKGTWEKYTNGLMYYRINLNDRTKTDKLQKYSVLRNSFYKVDIQNVNDLGFSDIGDLIPVDPEIPVEPDMNIIAKITVQEWAVVDMPEDLG